MKKRFFIAASFIATSHLITVPSPTAFRQMPYAQPPQPLTAITDKTINLFYDMEFQKEFKNVVQEFRRFKISIENLHNQIIAFSKQNLNFQKNYDNFERLFVPYEQIKQKPLSIAITKLLQYKSRANKANLISANRLINDLTKLLEELDTTLHSMTGKPELTANFFNSSPKVAAKPSIAEVFKDALHTKFPLKIKKIRRATNNWGEI